MAESEIDHLLKMANDITANFSYHDDAAERIADHIGRFWAPRMRRQLIEYSESGNHGLPENLASAIALLR